MRSTAQPAADGEGKSLRARRQTIQRVAPPRSGLRSQGRPSAANGVSSKAKPGQYEEMTRPSTAASRNSPLRTGTSRGRTWGGTSPQSDPRANARAWKSGAYSSIESGWRW